VLQSVAFVYELQSCLLLRAIDTPPNPQGTSCLSSTPEGGSLLALPCEPACGKFRCSCLSVCVLAVILQECVYACCLFLSGVILHAQVRPARVYVICHFA